MTAHTGSARPRPSTGRLLQCLAIAVSLTCMAAFIATAQAIEDLTPAQNLVYDTAHLSNTVAGQRIDYRYRGRLDDGEDIEDSATLLITAAHEADKRDVSLNFLSAERHLPLPDFTGFRGNPVIIAMLEHIAQSFGHETGGGVLYFRNRIRDCLAGNSARIEQVDAEYRAATVKATRLSFQPFDGDPYLAQRPEYTGAVFSITLSEAVPGGVISVAVHSGENTAQRFTREISIIE